MMRVRHVIVAVAWAFSTLVLLVPLRADVVEEIGQLERKFSAELAAGNYDAAEEAAGKLRTIAEEHFSGNDRILAVAVNNQARVAAAKHQYASAEKLFQWVLSVYQQQPGADRNVATLLNSLALLHAEQGHYAQAEPLYKQSLALREQSLGTDSPDVATSLNNLAVLYKNQGRFSEAEPLYKRSLAILEKDPNGDKSEVAIGLGNLGDLSRTQLHFDEAEKYYQQSLALREKLGEPSGVAGSLNNLAMLYVDQGRYSDAEELTKRSLAMWEKAVGPAHPEVATSLNNLAAIYKTEGRFVEAEPLYRRSLAIREKSLGPDHPDVATTLNNLANAYEAQGRFAEAETLYKRSLAIMEKLFGDRNPQLAAGLNNLAVLYKEQGRFAEAEPLYQRSLAMREAIYGHEHPEVATSLGNLATLYVEQNRYAEAERLYSKALAIREKALGGEHPDVAANLGSLARVYTKQRRFAEAESMFQRALAILEKVRGDAHPDTAYTLANLAGLYKEQGRDADAEPLLTRAMGIFEKLSAKPDAQFGCYRMRAELHWKAGRRQEALADQARQMDLAEQMRSRASGSETDQAAVFGNYFSAFERMVAWQVELGDFAQAFAALERSRARSLIDQMQLQGTSLLAGVPPDQADALRQRDRQNKIHMAQLQKQLALLERQKDLSGQEQSERRQQIIVQMGQNRKEAFEIYRDTRNASPAYRLMADKDFRPLAVDTLRQWVAQQNGLLLQYMLGDEAGYVFVVNGNEKPQAQTLAVAPDLAVRLHVKAGPLTAAKMQDVLHGDGHDLHALLSSAATAPQAMDRLAALWQVIVPESIRSDLIGGKYQRLLVVPDGALAMVPLDVLVVRPGENPKYLLDVGPPIVYGPSATVLYNLAKQESSKASDREPVLSVGNPTYPGSEPRSTDGEADAVHQLTALARYALIGGRLDPLPETDSEVDWIVKDFRDAGLSSVAFKGKQATEDTVRQQIAGRQIVHLACHGLTDQKYGNFYGALALTPGNDPNEAANDGFLTLPEIYSLNLKGCELAILSACETNYGPQQKGEGVWALSRGFLVAGSRRVVASDWLVDDEAGASLVSYFCGALARAEKAGKAADYADALLQAKRWVRQQDNWANPYYWGPLVLVGPN